MIKPANFFKDYFSGIQNISNHTKNDLNATILTTLKIFSCFTIAISLAFVAIYTSVSLYGRISKKQPSLPGDKNVNAQAKQKLQGSASPPDVNAQAIKIVRTYTNDLSADQKLNLKGKLLDENTLQISFSQAPTIDITIRRQDIFKSGAQVIVNAANTHLGGGSGIDGQIHDRGGKDYQRAHEKLRTEFDSKYISGYAVMIESGLLKESPGIDNVIVVAGPQGFATFRKEKQNELYSCYYNSLILAGTQNKTSIAFPSISTGFFSFPKDRAASISLKAIHDFINDYPNTTLKTISIHFSHEDPKRGLETDLEIYQKAL